MTERTDRTAAAQGPEVQREHLGEELAEGASPGSIGALDGTAAVGSLGAVSGDRDGVLPETAPDPSVGPD